MPLTLQVNPLNPARALYVRLGFISQGLAGEGSPGAGAFIEMAWRDPLTTPEHIEASPS